VKTDVPVTIRKPDGTEELAPPVMRVIDRVRHVKDIQLADFRYLRSQTTRTPKVTIPSPTMLHFRGGRAGISSEHYPDLEAFYQDSANAYGAELRSLDAAGCTYVQMDDTNLAYLCDPKMQEAARLRGDDPNELPHRYANFINRVVAQKPPGMTLCTHLCRGNFKSTWAAAGGYEPVAEALLSEMKLDGYFLEMRVLEHRARERNRDGGAGGQAAARGRGRARGLGRGLTGVGRDPIHFERRRPPLACPHLPPPPVICPHFPYACRRRARSMSRYFQYVWNTGGLKPSSHGWT
jgi:hypothetical protein